MCRPPLSPDRLVFGLPDGDGREHALTLLSDVYATPLAQGVPLITTDYATAELVKAAANSFLATKISLGARFGWSRQLGGGASPWLR